MVQNPASLQPWEKEYIEMRRKKERGTQFFMLPKIQITPDNLPGPK
jgi:hypothetical protein